MEEILETAGQYRVRLETDQDPTNPRTDQDNLCHVITVPGSRYIDVDANGGPLQDGWDLIKDRADAVEVFTRWARTFHGAVVEYHTPERGANSVWYLMPDQFAEVPDPKKHIGAEITEYQNWADGEVYGYIIEKSVAWMPTDEEDCENLGERTTWEHVDSCWGYVGYEYAKSAALEEFAPHKAKAELADN